MTKHLLAKTLAPDQKLAKYYGREGGIHDPETEELAQQVAVGEILFSEATDVLMRDYVRGNDDLCGRHGVMPSLHWHAERCGPAARSVSSVTILHTPGLQARVHRSSIAPCSEGQRASKLGALRREVTGIDGQT